jgi:membrane protease YdiL (CAAX protease family)
MILSKNIKLLIGLFYILAFTISWVPFYLISDVENTYFNYIIKFGFTLSAIILLFVSRDKNRARRILHQFSLHNLIKYGWIATLPILAYAISVLIMVPFDELKFVQNQSLNTWLYQLFLAPSSGILIYALFRGGMGEEIGLRGYVLPLLSKQFSLIKASTILGLIWAIWHYPIWLEQGIINTFLLTLVVIFWSYIFTYVFVKTKSLVITIFLHAIGNSMDDFFEWMLPSIKDYNWELGYALSIAFMGIWCGYKLIKAGNINLDYNYE